ncbi:MULTISPECIES: hypothetical protein [Streptomyces]|uniref:hypothetical protein n=1 Tax=Streptomyces TaxID=1883 RepID=UPI00225149E2|nr:MULTISPECIES: hypothetical protein [Streptomyces]MCX4504580.1 hypothetical protein [Streptomyces anulatus]
MQQLKLIDIEAPRQAADRRRREHNRQYKRVHRTRRLKGLEARHAKKLTRYQKAA